MFRTKVTIIKITISDDNLAIGAKLNRNNTTGLKQNTVCKCKVRDFTSKQTIQNWHFVGIFICVYIFIFSSLSFVNICVYQVLPHSDLQRKEIAKVVKYYDIGTCLMTLCNTLYWMYYLYVVIIYTLSTSQAPMKCKRTRIF